MKYIHIMIHDSFTLTHGNTEQSPFVTSTQALIYKSAEHEIKLFNHILLVPNTFIMRAIHYTGSMHSVPCKVRRNA